MDINDLLQSSSAPSSRKQHHHHQQQRPTRPALGKRVASGLSHEVRRSPDKPASNPNSRPSSAREHHVTPAQQFPQSYSLHALPEAAGAGYHSGAQSHPTSNPTSNPTVSRNSNYDAYGQRPGVYHRNSTPQMETLADLASMQQRPQPSRTASSNSSLLQAEIDAMRRSPSLHQTSGPPLPPMRTHSGHSFADLTMAEGPAQTPPPRDFSSTALSDAESKTVNDLLNDLAENSYAYDLHVSLINLLHKGFVAHVRAAADDDDQTPADLHGYTLLTELRQAREAMDSRFAVGEDLWVDWLADETLLADSTDSRISLMELFQKAVQDVPASVKVWKAYYDWVSKNHAICNDLPGTDQTGWSDDDKEMCKELFTSDMLVTVAEQAANATQWRLDESRIMWTRFAQLLLDGLPATPAISDIERVRDVFIRKLQTPHAGWSETSQMFWPVVNKFEPDNWELAMAQVNQLAEPGKKEMQAREHHEHKLSIAIQSGDKDAIFNEFATYMKWEQFRKAKQQGPHTFEIRCGLYERALLCFPTYTDWWLDYIDYAITNNPNASALPIIERATRHCPWSGDLWARRILRSDVEGKSHDEIEGVKHRATNSGLLDVGGMEELLKVLQQWCSYLRRHAFKKDSSEDDLDTAEVGITMALEDIQQAGKRVYGEDFQGDPLYRLETIQIKFYGEARRLNDAREIFRRLAITHKNSATFWQKYYVWELMLWSFERISETHRVETTENGPHLATAVIQEAISQRELDQPEVILETYLNHFQQHESSVRLQSAMVDAREFSKHLANRRAKEATEAVELAAQQPAAYTAEPAEMSEVPAETGREKRKADDTLTGGSSKKTKTDDAAASEDGSTLAPQAQNKRDREHSTITLKNLPSDIQELDINKFFRDIGKPKSIIINKGSSTNSATATVEFENQDDVLAAKTRNGKEINGQAIQISSGNQSTLYVANYPPEYDEAAMTSLFGAYGEIVSIRFPSLKFNNRRRFCYVSFVDESMAKAAEDAMDGKMLDGHHRLMAKIANPDAKKQRSGAQAEGRELIVKNLPWSTNEEDVKKFFAQYGDVSSLKLLKLVNGRLTGTGFIVYESVDEANAALAAHNKPFGDRILQVELSSPKGGATGHDKAHKTDVIVKQSSDLHGRRGSDASMKSSFALDTSDQAKTVRERKIAILNLPETVNDARIKAAMEKYGSIVKIQLRREDRGAIIEFTNVNDAFNVRQGVDVSSLGENVRSGDVSELLAKGKKGGSKPFGMHPASVARPSQQRGGRRGGLGSKRGGLGFSAVRKEVDGDHVMQNDAPAVKKSNDDFRQMLEKSRDAAAVKKREENGQEANADE
ncbi:Hypothetical protein R9X50_00459600 [Acrodontium crateriforme]|uniref:RRM domain-containing protein n=1 Tax=Acrodontium crateriforme TaxID=150365 RepID=A0AAQ3M4Y0_9PEZI|nr:Hypothetical protein R9X50_00459600 [Acrodontium crateriforme]